MYSGLLNRRASLSRGMLVERAESRHQGLPRGTISASSDFRKISSRERADGPTINQQSTRAWRTRRFQRGGADVPRRAHKRELESATGAKLRQ